MNALANYSKKQRQQLLSILSVSSSNDLLHYWDALSITARYETLKKPEVGMVMVRAKTGGTGSPFNMGEMTVTRSVVSLQHVNGHSCDAIIGFGYTAGRQKEKAECIAVIDACCQLSDYQALIFEQLLVPLQAIKSDKNRAHADKVDTTKVNFFTMVRGE
ncbi:phosphonate C-P lyase system protein PhnG [Eionea flava]